MEDAFATGRDDAATRVIDDVTQRMDQRSNHQKCGRTVFTCPMTIRRHRRPNGSGRWGLIIAADSLPRVQIPSVGGMRAVSLPPDGLQGRFTRSAGEPVWGITDRGITDSEARRGRRMERFEPVSYTHLTLPTNREV